MSGVPADVGARAHVFVDDLDAPALAADDRHHLERVLRMRDGDAVTVSDGNGRWRACRLGAVLEPTSEIVVVTPSEPALTVGLALVKGERPELAVQKLTELDIDRIVLFAAARSVVHWDPDKAERATERLGAIARGAAMQSRRTRLPEIVAGLSFADAAALPGAALADRGGDRLSLATPCVLVGPEGGWADDERAVEVPRVALGGTILRSETAALTAGVLLATMRTRMAEKPNSDH